MSTSSRPPYSPKFRSPAYSASGDGDPMSMKSVLDRVEGLEKSYQEEKLARMMFEGEMTKERGERLKLEEFLNEEQGRRVTLEEELKALMGPVRKNTTDLEEGLQELAELSQHVQTEMSGQRDTLDGLLDTMQKTISIEDTHDLLEEVESRLNRKIRENSDSIHEMHEDFTDVCSKLVKKFTEENLTRDERIEENHKLFSDLFGKLDKRVNEDTSELGSLLAETKAKHDEMIEDISTLVQRQGEDIAGVSSKIDRSMVDKFEELSDVLDETRKTFSETVSNLDSKFSEELANQDERMAIENAHFSDLCKNLDHRMSEETVALDEKFSEICSSLDKQTKEKSADLKAKSISDHKYFTELCRKLEKKIADDIADLDDRFTNRRIRRLDDLSNSVQQHYKHFTERCNGIEKKQTLEVAKEDERSADMHKYFSEKFGKLDSKVSQEVGALDGQLTEFVATVDQQIVTLQDGLKQAADTLGDRCTRLDQKYQEENDAVSDRIQDIDENFTDMYVRTQNEMKERNDSIDEKLERDYQYLVGQCTDLDTKFSQADADVNERLSVEISRLEKSTNATVIALDKRQKQDYEHWDDVREDLDRRITDERSNLDMKFSEKCSALDKDMDSLNAIVETHHTHFSDVYTQLDKKFTDKTNAQDERMDEYHKLALDLCTKLDHRLTEETNHLDQLFTETTEAHEKHMEELGAKLDEQGESLGDVCAAIEKKFTEQCGSLNEAVSHNHKHVTTSHAQLEKRFSEENDALVERIENEHKYFSVVCSKLTKQVTDENAELDEKFTEICTRLERRFNEANEKRLIQETRVQFTDLCNRLDKKITKETAALDKKFTDATAKVDKKFSAEITEQDQRIEDQGRHLVNNVCSTLEKRIYEENAQLDEKFTAACDAIEKKELVKNNEQDDTIDKQEQHFAVLCESLEQKLKEKTSLLDEKFTDVASLLDKKFTEENGKNSEKIESHNRHFTETCHALNKDLTEKTAEIEDKYNGITTKLEAQITGADIKLSQKCRELDGTLNNRTTDLNNKIESARSESASHLLSNVTELNAKIESQCSKLDKKVIAVETAAELKISTSVGNLQKGVDGALSNLDAKVDDSVAALNKVISESGKRLSKTFADADAASMEIRKAEHRHFTEECLKIDKKHDTKINELDMKFTNQFIREHQIFQTDQDEQDEKHNLELKHLREDYVKLETKASQDLDELERMLHEKNEKQDQRTDNVSRTVDQHHSYFETVTQQLHKKVGEDTIAQSSMIKENYKELKHECTKLDQKLSDENSFLHSKWTTEKQGIDARLDDLEHATESNRVDFSAEVLTLGKLITETSEEQSEARIAVLKHCNTASDNLEKKLTASILTLADRQETQGKHFSDTVTKVDKKFTESTTELNKRQVDLRAHLDAEVADKLAAADKNTKLVQKSVTDLINKEVQLLNDEIYELTDRLSETETKWEKSIQTHVAEIMDTISTEHTHFVGMCTNIDKAHSDKTQDLGKSIEELKVDSELRLTDMGTHLSESTKKVTEALAQVAKSTRDESERLNTLVDDCWKRLSDKCEKVAEKASRQFTEVDGKLATKEATLNHTIKDLGETLEKQNEAQNVMMNEINESHDTKNTEQNDRMETGLAQLDESITNLKQNLFEENAARDQRGNVENKKLAETIEKAKAKFGSDTQEIFRNFSQDITRHEKSVLTKLSDYQKKQDALDTRVTNEIARMEDSRNASESHLSNIFEDRWEKLNERITTEVSEHEKQIETQYEYFSTVCRRVQKDADENKIVVETKIDTRFRSLDERITSKASDTDSRSEAMQKLFEEKHEGLRKRLEPPLAKLEERLHVDVNRLESNLKLVASGQEERIENELGAVKADIDGLKKKSVLELRALEDKLSDSVTKLTQTVSDKTSESMNAAEAGIKGCIAETGKISDKLMKFKAELDDKVNGGIQTLQKTITQRTTDLSSRVETGFKRNADELVALERKTKESATAVDEKLSEKVARLATQSTNNKAAAEARSESVQKSLTDSFEGMKVQVAEQTEATEHRFVSRAAALELLITKNYDEQSKSTEDRHREHTYATERLEKTLQLELDDIRGGGEVADRAHDAKLLEMNMTIASNHDVLKAEIEKVDHRLEVEAGGLQEHVDSEVLRLETSLKPLEDMVETQYSHFTATFENAVKLVNIRVDHLSGAVTDWHSQAGEQSEEVLQQMSDMTEKHDKDLDELHNYATDNLKGVHKMFTDAAGELMKKIDGNKSELSKLARHVGEGIDETRSLLNKRVDDAIKKVEDKLPSAIAQQKEVDEVRSLCTTENARLYKELYAEIQEKFNKMEKSSSTLEGDLKKDLGELKESCNTSVKQARGEADAALTAVTVQTGKLRADLITKISTVHEEILSHKSDADERQDQEMKGMNSRVERLSSELTVYKTAVADQISGPVARVEKKIEDNKRDTEKKCVDYDLKIKALEEHSRTSETAQDNLSNHVETHTKEMSLKLVSATEMQKKDVEDKVEESNKVRKAEISKVYASMVMDKEEFYKSIKASTDAAFAEVEKLHTQFDTRLDREHTVVNEKIRDTAAEIDVKTQAVAANLTRKYEGFQTRTSAHVEEQKLISAANEDAMKLSFGDLEQDVKLRLTEETETRAQNIADLKKYVNERNLAHQSTVKGELGEMTDGMREHKTFVQDKLRDTDSSVLDEAKNRKDAIDAAVEKEAITRANESSALRLALMTEIASETSKMAENLSLANENLRISKKETGELVAALDATVTGAVTAKCDSVGDKIAQQQLDVAEQLDSFVMSFKSISEFIEETEVTLEGMTEHSNKSKDGELDDYLGDMVREVHATSGQ